MTIEKDGLLCEEFEKIDYVGIELQYGNDLVEYGLKLSIGYNIKKRKCYISRIREDVDDFWTDITAGNYTVFFEPRRNEIDRGSLFSRILDKLHYFLFWVISPKISELKEKFKIKK
jgi:hypothetical protein